MKKKITNNEDYYDLDPIIEIETQDGIYADYYKDLSGHISIFDNEGEEIFFKEDGKLKHHLQYLKRALVDLEKKYQQNVKKFNKAISLLEREQKKLK